MCGYHAAYSSYILPLTLACYRLGQSRDSDVVTEDHHMFYKCYFAAVWNSLDVPAPDDCISAINPKMTLRPMILPSRFQPAWRLSQGVAELGHVLLPAHMGIRSTAVKMFIIHIFNSVQPFSVVVTAFGDSQNLGMSVVRWFVSSGRESHGSGCQSDHWCRV